MESSRVVIMLKDMTESDVLVLEAGPETDALIAVEVMGWKKDRRYPEVPGLYRDKETKMLRNVRPSGSSLGFPFKPSSDIRHAMEVIDHLTDACFDLTRRLGHPDGDWACSMNFFGRGVVFMQRAETPALAICRAVLLLKMRGC